MTKPQLLEQPDMMLCRVYVYELFRKQRQGRLRSQIGETIKNLRIWDMIVIKQPPLNKTWPADFARRWNSGEMKAAMRSTIKIKAFTKHGRIHIIRTQ